jgi:hypothetical protein
MIWMGIKLDPDTNKTDSDRNTGQKIPTILLE